MLKPLALCHNVIKYITIQTDVVEYLDMETIVVATGNKNKIKEIGDITRELGIAVVSKDELGFADVDVVEDGETFEENSRKKAVEIMKLCNKPTLADDSGLQVDYLDGAPGIHSARFAGEEHNDVKNYEKLLSLLEGVPWDQRKAKFVTVITLVYPDGREIVARGECHGHIAERPVGDQGFGYDPVFVPDGYEETFAQLGTDVKNHIGHRSKALNILSEKLKEMHIAGEA